MAAWEKHPYGMLDSEKEANRQCQLEHRAHWRVIQRNGNASAFNGYHWTPSDYSAVRCTLPDCRRVWRTKAAYVDQLPDLER
jgi:hypothetical protein